MAFFRMLLKYFYPKPRKKSVLALAVLFVILFALQRTSHRKIKHSLLQGNSLFAHSGFGFNSDTPGASHKNNGFDFIPDNNRFEKIQSAYNVTIEIPKNVLVFTGSDDSIIKDKLKFLFKSMKINFDFITWNRLDDYYLSLPRLIDKYGNSRYQAFLFTNENIFDYFDGYNWDLIKRHCNQFNVGMIVFCFTPQTDTIKSKKLKSLPLTLLYGIPNLEDVEVPESPVLKLVKSPNILVGEPPGRNPVLFHTRHSTFQNILLTNVAYDRIRSRRDTSESLEIRLKENGQLYSIEKSPIALYDQGKIDGVRKFIFGVSFWDSWLYQLVLFDALGIISNHSFGYGLERHLQIDIDDMFVGKTGRRLIKEDIVALVKAQKYLASKIPGFRFYLGYSAQRYQLSNNSLEQDGDEYLMRRDVSKHFSWFCHTSRHIKPHEYTEQQLVEDFEINKEFAIEHGFEVDNTYAVAPHHSGVYPIHAPLYAAWKKVYGIKVTSTEGYPHLYPAHSRKGFIFQDVMVLPRQTCGLFTKTTSQATHPKGPGYLHGLTQGGELFWTVILNPINIYMTHMNNYGMKERLAIPLFTNLTDFVNKWTNIHLISIKPVDMANKYFEIFQKQMEPLWSDPCTDLRHQKIWAGTSKYCEPNKKSTVGRFPDVLIVGPQKSGTTALLTFLSLHPEVVPSRRSNRSYEEIQFFNKNNYKNGIDWYLQFFPAERKNDELIYLDKSANYFDSLKAPLRASSILPLVKLIVILIDPKQRAYSWYQHMRSKKEPSAFTHTFYDVITGNNKTEDDFKFNMLNARCLLPGRYAEALERWLQYYDKSQLLLIDGDELKEKPVTVMGKIQSFLGLASFPFHKLLKYNAEKKFYCIYKNNKFRCLGKGKGRHYGKMTGRELRFLSDYYHLPNMKLYDLLKKIGKPAPKWLQAEMKPMLRKRR